MYFTFLYAGSITPEEHTRLTHKAANYSLFELVNEADGIISFSYYYYGVRALSSARNLAVIILRERQTRVLPKRLNPPITPANRRFWDLVNDEHYFPAHANKDLQCFAEQDVTGCNSLY